MFKSGRLLARVAVEEEESDVESIEFGAFKEGNGVGKGAGGGGATSWSGLFSGGWGYRPSLGAGVESAEAVVWMVDAATE
jgi:hypothetical protein